MELCDRGAAVDLLLNFNFKLYYYLFIFIITIKFNVQAVLKIIVIYTFWYLNVYYLKILYYFIDI